MSEDILAENVKMNISFFIFLLNESMAYLQKGIQNVTELELKLKSLGHSVGLKMFELMAFREKHQKRYLDRIALLSFVSNQFWKFVFGKQADSLEKNVEKSNEFMIWETCPLYCKYLTIPKELGDFTIASFTAGIIESVLMCSNQVTSF